MSSGLMAITGLAWLLLPATVGATINVVATIPDFGDVAKHIGGDRVSVVSLVKGTQDPHFVEAKPSMTVSLNRADMLVLAGLQLEVGWLPPLMSAARNGKIQPGSPGYVDCSTFIEPKEVPVGTPDRAQGDIHPGGNPHYWTDPRNMLLIARGIAARLQRIDPGSADAYAAGLASFEKELTSAMARWEARLSKFKGTKVVVFHRSWSYFLDWSGLVSAGELEPKPGIEPSPSHVADLIRRVSGLGVRLVLQESFYPKNLSRIFAQKAGAKLLVVPTMTGAAGTTGYIDMMNELVDMIASALEGK